MSYGRILVVDDDPVVSQIVGKALRQEGYEVEVAETGAECLKQVIDQRYDLMILDVFLPGIDGFSLCREIRRQSLLPILMLSSRGEDIDKILGLEVGADDYLTKPFNPKELVARVRALLRRWNDWSRRDTDRSASGPLRSADLSLDPDSFQAELKGQPLGLTTLEFGLLHALMANPGRVLTRETLLDRVWGANHSGDPRLIDVHVRNLRRKLREADPHREYIQAVRGVGYKLAI
ncbi:MAG: response regulator transcription factor [Candidatus Eremiobacterota bacterium]